MKARIKLVFTIVLFLIIFFAFSIMAQNSIYKVTGTLLNSEMAYHHSPLKLSPEVAYASEIGISGILNYMPVVLKNYTGVCSTTPTLISPANTSALNTLIPVFSWDLGNDPDATESRLQVAYDDNFTNQFLLLYMGQQSGSDQFRFWENLDPATTYYWRIWIMCGDVQGPYSEVWSFTTGSNDTILPAPTLISPANGSTISSTSVNLQWSPVPGAIEYAVYTHKIGQGGRYITFTSSTQITKSVDLNSTYEWWVIARNDYAWSEYSEVWQFNTPAGSSSFTIPNWDQSFMVRDGDTKVNFEEQGDKK